MTTKKLQLTHTFHLLLNSLFCITSTFCITYFLRCNVATHQCIGVLDETVYHKSNMLDVVICCVGEGTAAAPNARARIDTGEKEEMPKYTLKNNLFQITEHQLLHNLYCIATPCCSQ